MKKHKDLHPDRELHISHLYERIQKNALTHQITSKDTSLMPINTYNSISLRPIQSKTIPFILAQRSITVYSETGSGKSAAYTIPYPEILQNFGGKLLILLPARELVDQIFEEFHKWNKNLNIVKIKAGKCFDTQRIELNKANIIISTVGRLYEHIEMGSFALNSIKYLVIDEVDKIVSDGMGETFNLIYNKLKLRAVQAFSATRGTFTVGKVISIGRINQINKLVRLEFVEGQLDIKKHVFDELSLIFCSRITTVDTLAKLLPDAAVLHSKKSMDQRETAMHRVLSGNTNILICTDVASRGIDIQNVKVVINYEFPESLETFVHRAGRTGRNGPGLCISYFYNCSMKVYPPLRRFLRDEGIPVPDFIKDKSDCIID